MPHCPNCGEEFSIKQKFCRNCGHNLSGSPETIECNVTVFPSIPDSLGLKIQNNQEIAKRTDRTTHTKVFGSNYKELTFQYTKNSRVAALDNELEISGGGKIDYDEILNVRFVQDEALTMGYSKRFTLNDSNYIALTVANRDIKAGDEHGNPRQSTSHSNGVFYVYFVGAAEEILYHGDKYDVSNDEFNLSNVASAGKEDLTGLYEKIKEKCGEPINEFVLQDYIQRPSHLKVEGWQDLGTTNIQSDIEGSVQTSGKTKGAQIGPYISTKSKSEGTIAAELNGSIDDDSFISEIDFLRIAENGIFIDSDPVLDFDYEAIDKILKRDGGFSLEAGNSTYTVLGPEHSLMKALGKKEYVSLFKHSQNVESAIQFMKTQVEKDSEVETENMAESTHLSQKIRELKELHEDGILSDEEFQSKKEELLEDF